MNKKHTLMFLLLSMTVLSLSCVYADTDSVSSAADTIVSDDMTDYSESADISKYKSITKEKSTASKESDSYTHNVSTSDDLFNFFDSMDNLTGTHSIELNDEIIINDDFYIKNNNLELIFNGNGNQLTLNSILGFEVKKVTFNNLVLESDGIIHNYADMVLDNVTIKNTPEYNNLVNIFKENGYYDFNDFDGVCDLFDKCNLGGMSIENDKILHVNNCHFINNAGHTGCAIYNDGTLYVDNSVFEDSIAKFGIIYSNNEAYINNCEFIANRVLQQLIMNTENSELKNCVFKNNRVAGSGIVDNRGSIKIMDSEFSENMVSYELIDNWNYMELSDISLENNSCNILINSFGNLTLTDSIIKNNTCNRNIICSDTIYDSETGEIDATGNVTLTNNRIFRGNVGFCDFLNNKNHGNLSLHDNIIYDEPDYQGNCLFEQNTFIADENLYDSEGNYQGYTKELYIDGHLNYEVVDKTYSGIIIIIEDVDEITLGESAEINGFLKYYDDSPITNEKVVLNYYEEGNYEDNEISGLSDEKGRYSFTITPAKSGKYDVVVMFKDVKNYTRIYILEEGDKSVKTVLTVDPLKEEVNVDKSVQITGSLTDADNNPIADKIIYMNTEEGSSDDGFFTYYDFNTTTDENGRYTFNYTPTHLESLNVFVNFMKDDTYKSSENYTSSRVVRRTVYASLNPIPEEIHVGENVLLSGRLTTADNDTLADEDILIYFSYGNDSDASSIIVQTDENGEYSYNYTPDTCGRLNIVVYAPNDKFTSDDVVSVDVNVVNNTETETVNNTETDDDNKNHEEQQNNSPNNSFDNKTTHTKTVNNKITNNKKHDKVIMKTNVPGKNVLKPGSQVTLSWLNSLFNMNFYNKQLLIYINGTLVFNGTVSEDSSEALFKVLEEFKGEQELKVVADNETYQREVTVL